MQPVDIMDDFKKILKKHNYSEDDFSIKDKDTTDWTKSRIASIREIVTVKNLKSGKEKCYDSGDCTDWLGEFEKDLKNGLFS